MYKLINRSFGYKTLRNATCSMKPDSLFKQDCFFHSTSEVKKPQEMEMVIPWWVWILYQRVSLKYVYRKCFQASIEISRNTQSWQCLSTLYYFVVKGKLIWAKKVCCLQWELHLLKQHLSILILMPIDLCQTPFLVWLRF